METKESPHRTTGKFALKRFLEVFPCLFSIVQRYTFQSLKQYGLNFVHYIQSKLKLKTSEKHEHLSWFIILASKKNRGPLKIDSVITSKSMVIVREPLLNSLPSVKQSIVFSLIGKIVLNISVQGTLCAGILLKWCNQPSQTIQDPHIWRNCRKGMSAESSAELELLYYSIEVLNSWRWDHT